MTEANMCAETFHYLSHVERGNPSYDSSSSWYYDRLYDETIHACQYCGAAMTLTKNYNGRHENYSVETSKKTGGRCTQCFWWYIRVDQRFHSFEPDGNCADDEYRGLTLEGTICHFQADFWKEALAFAERDIRSFRKRLCDCSPREVERLMGELISQYRSCDVHHVGRSGDGGVDLIVIEGDQNIAVQVKHRSFQKEKETVVPLREFVGAMVLGEFSQGIFITTAAEYTAPATETAKQAARVFAPLNLVAIRDIRAMIKNVATNQWQEYESLWHSVKWKIGEL